MAGNDHSQLSLARTWRLTLAATLRMRSRSATDVPPYFCTTSVTGKLAFHVTAPQRPCEPAPSMIDGWPSSNHAALDRQGTTRESSTMTQRSATSPPIPPSSRSSRPSVANGGMPPGRWRLCTSSTCSASPTSVTARATISDSEKAAPLSGLAVLDVGCGGLLAEPLARWAAPSPRSTRLQPTSTRPGGTPRRPGSRWIQAIGIEALAADGATFDLVIASEVVEHVADVAEFVAAMAAVTRPAGLVVLSTLSRTAASFITAVIGAEYLLGWLPRGTPRLARSSPCRAGPRSARPTGCARSMPAASDTTAHATASS